MNTSHPYIFCACRSGSGTNPARICAREAAEHCKANPYGRLYVKIEPYSDLACPTYALKNGTFFNELYMPYMPPEAPAPCGKCGGEKR